MIQTSSRSHRLRVALAACAFFVGASCTARPNRGSGELTDDLGRAISLAAPAERIVSLSPATTELLFAIGAGDRLVGRTRWAEYPPDVEAVPSVGDGIPPNVELVVAQRPDLVVMYASASNAQAIDRLAAMGVPSFNIRMDRLESVPRGARALGRLSGVFDRADRLATDFERQLDSAANARNESTGPKVLILTWDNPPIVIGGDSFLSEFLTLAGARNAFADLDAPSAPVSIEAIVARAPDVVLVTGDSTVPAWSDRPEWRAVKAVADRRFAIAPGSEFSWPSFRAFEAIRKLRAALAAVSSGREPA